MKKHPVAILVITTAICAAFLLGMFLGRNISRPSITISRDVSGVPTIMTTEPQSETETSEPIEFPIDLNTATFEELDALPGIGEVLAGRIIEYRKAHGSFSSTEEIVNVYGISTKLFETIKDLITVGG